MPGQTYPVARRGDVVDDYHGELVADPYRWLEDPDDPEAIAWTAAENRLTESFLSKVPAREPIRDRLTALWDYPKFGVSFERGGRFFQFRNSGLQDQPVLYVMKSPEDAGIPLLDPNVLSLDGTVAVSGLEVIDDGELLAYATSASGSDWMTWHVREVATGADRRDVVEWSKFSSASWRKDGSGFYYGAMERPSPGAEYLAQNRVLRVLFHRLGDDQSSDEVVFEIPDEPEWLPRAFVSDDGRYLVVSIERGTFPESQVHVLDLHSPEKGFVPLVPDFSAKIAVVTNVGRDFYLLTDDGAERQRIVAVSLDGPERSHWREVVAETDDTLLEAHDFGGHLVCHYLHHAHSLLSVHQRDGAWVREVPLPGIASLGGLEGRPESEVIRFSTTSFTESGSLWSHDLRTGETALLRASGARFDAEDFVTEQVFVPSDDGTQVPLFLTRRRDVSPDGEVPVLLYGYGGFGVPITPSFSVTNAVWLEQGGLLAVANLRGGGEYGRSWYDDGRLANKQNVFDDFCACARYLERSGWSRSGRIAINGASNGGLLVGACLTQHPELFGAAVAEVGVLDLLRFHKFTIGWAWTSDFGDPDDPLQYPWPWSYSPLHNVRPGASYPATLVMTGDHDDRVVPGHSFKFAAALQAAQGGDAPILIRVETSTGHGAGKPTAKLIAERTDLLAFLDATVGSGRGLA
ncbi:MAG: Prolyl oligopeptidase [Acidimicrobiaceae bacterium]|nr:Prolyl oligopeptidase [Acidimicrobiaceae bacterium]